MELTVAELLAQRPTLKVGTKVLLTGTIYTARDAAHKRMFQMLERGEPLPFEIRDAFIYYAGPTPGKNGLPTGSCGPTTSGRMDPYAPRLMDMGLGGTIGKGERSAVVVDAIRRNGSIYLCAVGGAGALIARSIKELEVIAFPDLGCESIKRLRVERLPLVVAINARGENIFERA